MHLRSVAVLTSLMLCCLCTAYAPARAETEEPMKRIALTFDDGPNTTTTSQVLDVLEENVVVASFFLISQHITPASREVVRRAAALGCEINNHSVAHLAMAEMTPAELHQNIDPCSEQIEAITGKAPLFFRPPYISVSQTLLQEANLVLISGSGCEDWEPSVSADERVRRVLAAARDGEIILLHDTEGNYQTVEALRKLIPALKEQGYTFYTCSGLFEACGVSPVFGRIYSNVFQTGVWQ